jgi:hypothetical protein
MVSSTDSLFSGMLHIPEPTSLHLGLWKAEFEVWGVKIKHKDAQGNYP